MKKSLFALMSLGLLLTACGEQSQKEKSEPFTDDVAVALSAGGSIDLNNLQWTREPAGYEVKGDTIVITIGSSHRPLATHLLSLPERQCPCPSDEDAGEVLQLCRKDRLHTEPSTLRPVRHRHVPG